VKTRALLPFPKKCFAAVVLTQLHMLCDLLEYFYI